MNGRNLGILACGLFVIFVATTAGAAPSFVATAKNLRGAVFLGHGCTPCDATEAAIAKCTQRSLLPFTCKVLKVRLDVPPPPPPPPCGYRPMPMKVRPKGAYRYNHVPYRSSKAYRSYSSPKYYASRSTVKKARSASYTASSRKRKKDSTVAYGVDSKKRSKSVADVGSRISRRENGALRYGRTSDLYLDRSKKNIVAEKAPAGPQRAASGSSQGTTASRSLKWGR